MNSDAMKLTTKAAEQVRQMMDNVRRANEQLTAYVQGLGAGMGVPDGWQLDPQTMAFFPPPAAPAAPEDAPDAAE